MAVHLMDNFRYCRETPHNWDAKENKKKNYPWKTNAVTINKGLKFDSSYTVQ